MRADKCSMITAALIAAITAGPSLAAERASPAYPSKPIRLIVPYAPGGGNDTMARAIGGKLTEAWSTQVIIDNRPGANGLLAGEIAAKAAPDGYTLFMVAALPQVRSKRLVPIAVTSLARSSSLPDVPAVAETAPGFEATSWWGVVTTGGTPQRIVGALNGEIVKALNTPDMKTFMARLGAEPRAMTPQEFSAFIRSELAKWGKVVRESGARAD